MQGSDYIRGQWDGRWQQIVCALNAYRCSFCKQEFPLGMVHGRHISKKESCPDFAYNILDARCVCKNCDSKENISPQT